MRLRWANAAATVFAVCFPWLSASAGGMVLCIDPCGRVAYGPGHGLSYAAAAVESEPACGQCLDEHGCADIPGKGLIHALSQGASPTRQQPIRLGPCMQALFRLCQDSLPAWPGGLPEAGWGGQHSTRARLTAHSTVVLRL
jgi:hypothetical protein